MSEIKYNVQVPFEYRTYVMLENMGGKYVGNVSKYVEMDTIRYFWHVFQVLQSEIVSRKNLIFCPVRRLHWISVSLNTLRSSSNGSSTSESYIWVKKYVLKNVFVLFFSTTLRNMFSYLILVCCQFRRIQLIGHSFNWCITIYTTRWAEIEFDWIDLISVTKNIIPTIKSSISNYSQFILLLPNL